MRPLHLGLAVAFFISLPTTALAQGDAAVAREQLKEGVELRKRGLYDEALKHLIESQRLDPEAKTLINLADCEEHLGRLTDALRDWLRARDLATTEKNEPIFIEAQNRLVDLEKRMPKL